MANKLNFFDWYDKQECAPNESRGDWNKWIESYAKDGAWKSYRTGEAVHDGDCTNMPYTCSLCSLTDLLTEYRDYYFDTSDSLESG